jgi:hypothetical protein
VETEAEALVGRMTRAASTPGRCVRPPLRRNLDEWIFDVEGEE